MGGTEAVRDVLGLLGHKQHWGCLGSFVSMTVCQGFECFCLVLEKNKQSRVGVVKLMMSCGVRFHSLHLPAIRSLKV